MNMSNSKELTLTDREEAFVHALVDSGGNIAIAEEAGGYAKGYGYLVRRRLAKHVAEAAQEYLAINSVKAAKKVVDTMDAVMPNPVQLTAAQAVLDRAGVVKKSLEEEQTGPTIKANIFILPEKRYAEIIDVTFTELKG